MGRRGSPVVPGSAESNKEHVIWHVEELLENVLRSGQHVVDLIDNERADTKEGALINLVGHQVLDTGAPRLVSVGFDEAPKLGDKLLEQILTAEYKTDGPRVKDYRLVLAAEGDADCSNIGLACTTATDENRSFGLRKYCLHCHLELKVRWRDLKREHLTPSTFYDCKDLVFVDS